MQTINAQDIQVGDTLVPNGSKVVKVARSTKHAKGTIVTFQVRYRNNLTAVSFWATDRVTVKR